MDLLILDGDGEHLVKFFLDKDDCPRRTYRPILLEKNLYDTMTSAYAYTHVHCVVIFPSFFNPVTVFST
jgi:hypothetical protein